MLTETARFMLLNCLVRLCIFYDVSRYIDLEKMRRMCYNSSMEFANANYRMEMISMNLARTILDGIVLCVIFNAVVGLFFFVTPQGYSVMFPKGIREAAKPYVTRKDRCIMHWATALLFQAVI